ncbi:MAG: hypothetical protein K8I60_21790 [Anaerolineae bacterium]|nr:hypothetical protein [Anaerolineae bacterium]
MASKAAQNHPEEMLLRVFRLAEILLQNQNEPPGTLMANRCHSPTTLSAASQIQTRKTQE